MDSQNKSSVLHWLIPTGTMLVVVMVMLFSFSRKSSKEAEATVSRTLISATESYGEKFLQEIEKVSKVGAPIGVLLGKEGVSDTARVSELLGIAAECAGVDEVIFCGADGMGLDQKGVSVDVSQESWYDAMKAASFFCVYAEEEQAVIIKRRISTNAAEGYLLLFYPMDKFENALLNSGYDSSSFLAVVDAEGRVMGASGATGNFCLSGGNLFEALAAVDGEVAVAIQNRINNGSRGSTEVKTDKQAQVLTLAPIGDSRWDMVLGVTEAYVERQAGYLRRNTKNMVLSLVIVIAVFFCVVMVINIVGKIRTNEKKKELEDKADTDQLTGLNNKLATERKIKEYMALHPDKQSMMFILDIDNFKKINDTMGHAFGDEVLRSLGIQIGAIFRASDIIGRVGGDEFMVFLKDISTDAAILKEAAKVENFFKSFQAGEYVKYKATASIGVAVFPQEGADFESLYKAADQGLYKAKKRGKNQLAFYKDRTPEEKPEG